MVANTVYAEEQGSNGEELYSSQLYPEYSNLEEMLADYQQRPQNNCLVELLPAEGMLKQRKLWNNRRSRSRNYPAKRGRC